MRAGRLWLNGEEVQREEVRKTTYVQADRAGMLVTATGAQTEVGKIGALIDEAVTRATPLEQKLARLGRLLIVMITGDQ